MLISDNFRHQFYEIVKKEHVLMIVGDDADALCAHTILTQLFIWDDVSYSMVPVGGWDALDKILRQHFDQSPTIVLLNCGGNRSLQDLQVPPESIVFVIDSRRPFHHENIFDGHQIRLLVDSVEIDQLKIPEIHDVIDEEESDEEESEEEPDDEIVKKGELDNIQKKILKQETKRQWKRRRNDILWQYYESAWYSVAISVRMLELAASLNRATPELMWIAAVGLNSQWTDKLITIEAYTDVCYNRMRPFIHKFSPRSAPKANDLLRVSFDKELPLAMYPHWSLYRAMMVNEHFACKTKNWTQKGDSDVKHLLANLGLTLNETKQKFEAMSSNRKKEVTDTLEKEMASSFASFIAHLGYCNRVNAADVARGVAARLETPRKQPLLERFESAQSVLLSFMDGTGDFMQMLKTFELYKVGLESVWALVASAVNQQEIIPVGPFFLYSSSHTLDSDIVESRHFLFSFAHFLLRAFAVLRRGRTARPLIITFPLGGDMQGWNLVTGVMPLNTVYEDNHQKSFICRAFERVEKQGNMEIKRDFFDPNIITIRSEDRSRFFDFLQTVMEVQT